MLAGGDVEKEIAFTARLHVTEPCSVVWDMALERPRFRLSEVSTMKE